MLTQTHQEEKRGDPNKQNKKWNRINNKQYHRSIKKIMKEYYEQSHANKSDNLEEINF